MIVSGIDFRSSPMELRHASTERPLFVIVPERRFLAIDGIGPPGAEDFRQATTVLRSVSDLLRRSLPKDPLRLETPREVAEITWPIDGTLTVDNVLEALDDPCQRWRQMVELPQPATEELALRAIDRTRTLAGRQIPLVRVTRLEEGPAVQILEIGDQSRAAAVRKLLRAVREVGFRPVGDLHELVLADPAAVGHDRARSILRVPVGPAAEISA
jgi:hypothetical protein